MEKQFEYAIKLHAAITSVFDADNENGIDPDELSKDNNLTHFIHALANLAPAVIYEELTNDKDKSALEFNHLANALIVQYTLLDKNPILSGISSKQYGEDGIGLNSEEITKLIEEQ